jgi:hypothetical protein
MDVPAPHNCAGWHTARLDRDERRVQFGLNAGLPCIVRVREGRTDRLGRSRNRIEESAIATAIAAASAMTSRRNGPVVAAHFCIVISTPLCHERQPVLGK